MLKNSRQLAPATFPGGELISHWAEWFRACFLADQPRWWLWFPVALGTGIATYFALSEEPGSIITSLVGVVALAVLVWHHRRHNQFVLFALVMALGTLLGFASCQWRASQIAAPAIPYQGSFLVEGRVVLAEPRRGKQRVVLDELWIDGLEEDKTPHTVRITLRKDEPSVRSGDRLAVKARLQPPSGPLLPGGFDFARQAWFQGLGGLGYAIGSLELRARDPQAGFDLLINGLRQDIADQASASIEGPSAAVAAALLTALRAGIEEQVWRDMQLAGLAHLLAISGLHMGLVAGTVFLAVRYSIALSPGLVVRWPAKKFAAVTAFAAAFFYLLLAGITIPTTRAFIMTGIALLALLVDRNPFSMRLVALAASIILLTRPEALLGASFQMSFAAVVGLIAFYESRPLALAKVGGQRGIQGWRLIWVYLVGVAVTTMIASLATAPLGAYHFQRVAAYGIAANLIGVPLTAFWIMPCGLLALAAMPLGLSAPFFWLMGEGIDILLALAHLMASLPGAGMNAGQMPLVVLIAFTLGALWLCLWQARWRWLGIGLWIGIVPIMLWHQPPDMVIERGGGLVALRNERGQYDLIRWRNDDFTIKAWQRALGGSEFGDWPKPGTGRQGPYACDEGGCTAIFNDRTISIARTAAAGVEDCGAADLLIATRAVDHCDKSSSFIGSRELWLSEGMSLQFTADGVTRRSVAAERGSRPWTIR